MIVPSDMAIGYSHRLPHEGQAPGVERDANVTLGTVSGDPGLAVHSLAARLALGAGTHEAEAV
jgi:hypothetical protein